MRSTIDRTYVFALRSLGLQQQICLKILDVFIYVQLECSVQKGRK